MLLQVLALVVAPGRRLVRLRPSVVDRDPHPAEAPAGIAAGRFGMGTPCHLTRLGDLGAEPVVHLRLFARPNSVIKRLGLQRPSSRSKPAPALVGGASYRRTIYAIRLIGQLSVSIGIRLRTRDSRSVRNPDNGFGNCRRARTGSAGRSRDLRGAVQRPRRTGRVARTLEGALARGRDLALVSGHSSGGRTVRAAGEPVGGGAVGRRGAGRLR